MGGTVAEPIRPCASARRMTLWQVTTVRAGSIRVEQVRLPVIDDVNHVGVEVAYEPRVDGEAAELDVELRPGRRARLPLGGNDGGRPQPRHGHSLLQERVAQPIR